MPDQDSHGREPAPSADTSSGATTRRSLTLSILGGPVGLQRDYGYPFQLEIISALEDLGYDNESTAIVEATFPDLPPLPTGSGPTATFGAEDLLVGMGIYTALKLGDAVISEVASRIYQGVVTPALEELWARVPRTVSNRHRPFELTAVFEHWFDDSRVLVRVVLETNTDEAAPTTRHVRLALEHAIAYVEEHGGSIELTYRVFDDRLQLPPTTRPVS
jgi:hypothetical protein